MSLTITTNISSMIAQFNLSKNTFQLNKVSEQMATGNRVNNASDDSAGLSISTKLQSQIRGSQKANENSQEGINLLQIAEGSLSIINENLQRIRELSVQAANATNASAERNTLKLEVVQRIQDILRIKSTTKYNKINLLDGSQSQYMIRTGANSNSADNSLDISSALRDALQTFMGVQATVTAVGTAFATNSGARMFLDSLDGAIKDIGSQRATIGTHQNRLQSIIETLTISQENLSSADSRIRNTDYAQASANLIKFQLLQNSTVQVLTQANNLPKAALNLLQQ